MQVRRMDGAYLFPDLERVKINKDARTEPVDLLIHELPAALTGLIR